MRTTVAAITGAGLVCAALLGAQATPDLVVRAPAADTELTGDTAFEADVIPAGAAVRYVAFYVDGTQVCRVAQRPYACSWDAGVSTAPRSIRVVAELADGLRLVKTLRTPGRSAPAPRFRGAADAVVVPVDVRDGRGRPVTGLTREDFALQEDGADQEIAQVLTESTGISVLLALDLSSSVAAVLGDLVRGAESCLSARRPQDTVSAVAFNSGFFVLSRPGPVTPATRASLRNLKPSGATALYDGLIHAADLMRTLPAPRVVVAFTDGADTASLASVDAVRTALQTNDIGLYLVLQGDVADGDEALRRIARETGGMTMHVRRMDLVTDSFASVVAELKTRYVLLYSPRRPFGDGRWRSITVDVVGRNDYAIRSRTGYYASRSDVAQ
jgi:Ca-activated chloride channel family protein